MRIQREKSFDRNWTKLPEDTKRRAREKIALLAENPRHPSLQAHKMGGSDIWEARISGDYRITYQVTGDVIRLRRIGTHEIYRNP